MLLVLNSIDQYRMLVPEGFFREGDDLSAIMKTIESIDERRNANHRPSQLRREPVPLAWKKTSQAALYAQLIGVEFERLIAVSKAQASAFVLLAINYIIMCMAYYADCFA